MAEQLIENSRQGFAAQKPPCTGLETDLSRNLRWGCGHVYDETPVGLAVYVRNDPVNKIDPDGRRAFVINPLVYQKARPCELHFTYHLHQFRFNVNRLTHFNLALP
jgi:hypothetical protein